MLNRAAFLGWVHLLRSALRRKRRRSGSASLRKVSRRFRKFQFCEEKAKGAKAQSEDACFQRQSLFIVVVALSLLWGESYMETLQYIYIFNKGRNVLMRDACFSLMICGVITPQSLQLPQADLVLKQTLGHAFSCFLWAFADFQHKHCKGNVAKTTNSWSLLNVL